MPTFTAPVVSSPVSSKVNEASNSNSGKMQTDSGEDYGYNSGDEEGLQTLTDVAVSCCLLMLIYNNFI